MMDNSTELKNRKKKNKSGQKTHDAVTGKVVSEAPAEEIIQQSIQKLKELKESIDSSRDQGDGDSTPDTPPNELAPDAQESGKSPKKKQRMTLEIDPVAMLLLAVALLTRFYKLEEPRAIVFDELHYGKYAGFYMKNMFFFDSQPPLGKQLLALAGYFSGFKGDFAFDRIGSPYNDTVPVFGLRSAPAFVGSLLAPTAYLLVAELGFSSYAAVAAGSLVILDNAVLTQTRFMLIEPFLLFFSLVGLLSFLRFRRCSSRPFSAPWWGWLVISCFSLGCALSVRFSGLLSLLLGLVLIGRNFWGLVSDRSVSDRCLLRHFVVRCVVAVGVPIAVYIGSFYAHLAILTKAGVSDNIMTSAFQASLEGGLASIVHNQPMVVAHGSQITLRHTHGRTCWMHSHDHVYPVKYPDNRGSSHQQQVSCYTYKDVNNWWIVKRPEIDDMRMTSPIDPIRHGDLVQIVHGMTSRALNSHDVAAPVSPHLQEVTCYIDYNISMAPQNLWKVDIINKDETEGIWHAVRSQVHLIHVNSSQALRFSGRQYPEWGFRQFEVVTDKLVHQEDTVWNVEEHRYTTTDEEKARKKELVNSELIPTAPMKLSFWQKFSELQLKMLFNNQENVQGHMYASDPLDWLFLARGVAYYISPDSNAQIHFLGNIVIWYSSTLSLFLYGLILVLYLLRRRRQCYDLTEDQWDKFCTLGEIVVCGYLFNYIPYFFIDHTFFLHHYLPAYIFAIILIPTIIDHMHFVLKEVVKSARAATVFRVLVGVWGLGVFFTFLKFSPVSYGNVPLSADQVMELAWKDTWDLIIHKP